MSLDNLSNSQACSGIALRHANLDDAEFIHELVNDPLWKLHIGDRNIHSIKGAQQFIKSGPLTSYQRHGFGMYIVELQSKTQGPNRAIGLCGLLQCEFLLHPDIGYAILPEFRGKGFTLSACQLVLKQAKLQFKLELVYAIISPANLESVNLIEKLGFAYIKTITHDESESLLHQKIL